MEGKENMASGVRGIGLEATSDYHVAPRSDASPQTTVSPAVMTQTGSGMAGVMEKKKRGRPRKYERDGSVAGALSPTPISASASPAAGAYSIGKRGRGRSSNSETKQSHTVETSSMGLRGGPCDGVHFTPHVITVNAGEDVTAKIISFCQQGPRSICILSANGTVSNATLRQPDSSGGTLTYEGRFEIVNLCGSFTPTDREGTRQRAGGLSVSLSHPNGHVVGGCVAGSLVAAAPVQIIVGSFLPSSQPEHKPKKQKHHPAAHSTTPVPALADKDGGSSRQGQAIPGPGPSMQTATPLPFGRDAWANAHGHGHGRGHGAQDSRRSTDINISLP